MTSTYAENVPSNVINEDRVPKNFNEISMIKNIKCDSSKKKNLRVLEYYQKLI